MLMARRLRCRSLVLAKTRHGQVVSAPRAPDSLAPSSPSAKRRAGVRSTELPCNVHNSYVVRYNTLVVSLARMTSTEFKRWLQKHGCTFEPGKGGHLIVRLGDKMSVLPMHGKQKELVPDS